ncbi:hypothetical protein KKH3_23230 [Pectobacterium actinidiae]|nr:hypothetical protein KKH3_23230 [Pectobacterium actinidiae]
MEENIFFLLRYDLDSNRVYGIPVWFSAQYRAHCTESFFWF